MKTLSTVAFCLAVITQQGFCAPGGQEGEEVQRLEWKRLVMDSNGEEREMAESAEVDVESQTMLMDSSDDSLKETQYHQSRSKHDFRAKTLGIAPEDSEVCFIGDIPFSFQETFQMLQRRAQGGVVKTEEEDGRTLKIASQETLDSSGSDVVDEFCEGRQMYRVTSSNEPAADKTEWRFFPPLLCFYGPIIIVFPLDLWDIFDLFGGFRPLLG